MRKLDSEGLSSNTLIIFSSDNGGASLANSNPSIPEEQLAGHFSNGPFRGGKGQIYEGGHRVPFIAKWGDGTTAGSFIEPGTVSDQFIMLQDWAATLYDLTLQDMPVEQAQDSKSLLPVLFSQFPSDELFRKYALIQAKEGDPAPFSIRKNNKSGGKWTLLLDKNKMPMELYNLTNDIAQQNNLINSPSQAKRITNMHSLFLSRDDQNDPRTTAVFLAANATPLPNALPLPGDSISVNFLHPNGSPKVDVPYGVKESSVWTNSKDQNLTDIPDNNGDVTTLDIQINAPDGYGSFGRPYKYTPLHTGPQLSNSASSETVSISLNNIPYSRYKVIVYLTGSLSLGGAFVSDSFEKFYWDSPDPYDSTLVKTMDTDSNDGIQIANYAEFGSVQSPRTSIVMDITMQNLGFGGRAGIGGLQIVELP